MDNHRTEQLGQTVDDTSVSSSLSLREPHPPAADDASNRRLGSPGEPATLGSAPAGDGTTTRCEPPGEQAILPSEPPIRVMALHALLYCERLFYLEEVEEIRVADAAVYAGRRLHDDVVPLDDETPERRSVQVSSERWGIFGKVDALRRRDGVWVAYEHKRGRCRRGDDKRPRAWPSDRVQAIAYAVLLEEALGEAVPQARVRYHADNVTAFVDVDDGARRELADAIQRARQLRRTTDGPPVTENENLCCRCSLAPVCLPEEERLPDAEPDQRSTPTLFPSNRERQTLHVVSPGARVGRSGEVLVVTSDEGKQRFPIGQLDAVVVHGFGQVTTQAIHLCALCARRDVSVQWLTAGGRFTAGTAALRAAVSEGLDRIREALKKIPAAASASTLLGLEGIAAKSYFACLPELLSTSLPEALKPNGRTKHPPRDRFNCALSFGYALVYSLVQRSILAVGLEPAFGFYHQPRTAAPPLVLDAMELFRTPLWEMPLVGSLNRGQWDVDEDFDVRPGHVWLSDSGRKKAIQLFEQRLQESYKHPHTGQSRSYARMVELEVRLLEKEWTGCPGQFARLRMR